MSIHDSEPVQHLKNSLKMKHTFNWFIIANTSNSKPTRKNLEAVNDALKRPKLKQQVKSHKIALLKNLNM